MKTHKDLEVWKQSIRFVQQIYDATSRFPKNELFGITDQIRRAAISIPANISEGSARKSSLEFRHFLSISFGSIAEVETLLIIASGLGYLENERAARLETQVRLITSQLSGLYHAIDKKIKLQNSKK
jgi:four helix bundle protein